MIDHALAGAEVNSMPTEAEHLTLAQVQHQD
jgi:hypothetical protein